MIIISADNGLLCGQHQAIIGNQAIIGTNLNHMEYC